MSLRRFPERAAAGSCLLASWVRANRLEPAPWLALSHKTTHGHLGPPAALLRGTAAAGTFANGPQAAEARRAQRPARRCSTGGRCPALHRSQPRLRARRQQSSGAGATGTRRRGSLPPGAGSCSFAGGLDAPCIPRAAAA